MYNVDVPFPDNPYNKKPSNSPEIYYKTKQKEIHTTEKCKIVVSTGNTSSNIIYMYISLLGADIS